MASRILLREGSWKNLTVGFIRCCLQATQVCVCVCMYVCMYVCIYLNQSPAGRRRNRKRPRPYYSEMYQPPERDVRSKVDLASPATTPLLPPAGTITPTSGKPLEESQCSLLKGTGPWGFVMCPQGTGPWGFVMCPQGTGPWGFVMCPQGTGPWGFVIYPQGTGPWGFVMCPQGTGPWGFVMCPQGTGPWGFVIYPQGTGPWGFVMCPQGTGPWGFVMCPQGTGPWGFVIYPQGTIRNILATSVMIEKINTLHSI